MVVVVVVVLLFETALCVDLADVRKDHPVVLVGENAKIPVFDTNIGHSSSTVCRNGLRIRVDVCVVVIIISILKSTLVLV